MTESSVNSPESTVAQPAGVVSVKDTPLSRVEAILAAAMQSEETQTPADEPQETEDSPADAPIEKWDIKSLAEKLGTEPAKLYEQLKVSLADGEEVTVSELKDRFRPAQELEKARKAFGEDQARAVTELEEAKREFTALLSSLDPRHLTPENLRMAQEQSEAWKSRQTQGLLKALPEWKDPVSRTADWADIGPVAREYGFSETDVALAKAGQADYRFIHAMRDLARLKAKERAGTLKPAPKVAAAPKPARPQTEAQKLGAIRAQVTKGNLSKVAAVEAVLKGAGVVGNRFDGQPNSSLRRR